MRSLRRGSVDTDTPQESDILHEVPEEIELPTPAQSFSRETGNGEHISIVDESGESSDIARAINALLGDDARTKSELEKDEVKALTLLLEIGERYKAKHLLQIGENFLSLMISHKRGSRGEVVNSFSGMMNMRGQGQANDIVNRLRGQ